MKDKEQLKPCPFCGGKVYIESYTVDSPIIGTEFSCRIYCPKCDILFKKRRNRMEDDKDASRQYLTDVWNTRC